MQRKFDDSSNSIRQTTGGKETSQRQGHRGFGWVGRHPGVALLGAMIVVILALPKPSSRRDVERDTTGEEVPLFV